MLAIDMILEYPRVLADPRLWALIVAAGLVVLVLAPRSWPESPTTVMMADPASWEADETSQGAPSIAMNAARMLWPASRIGFDRISESAVTVESSSRPARSVRFSKNETRSISLFSSELGGPRITFP